MNQFQHTSLIVARESRGLTQKELSEKTEIPQSTLSKFEGGVMNPDSDYLQAISVQLDYPISFFYRKMEIYPPNLHYRKRVVLPSKILARVEAIMNIYKTNLEELFKSVDFTQHYLPSAEQMSNLTPQEAARFLRQYWQLPKGVISNLTTLLESKGIVVIHFDFGTDKVDGRSIITKGGVPIVFINSVFPGDRQRFTLAHELGHIVMHLFSPLSSMVDVEEEAFIFAAEFLAPQNEIYPSLKNGLTIPKLADLKRYWKISMQAIVYWAQRMGAITAAQAKYLWSQFNAQRIKQNEPIVIEKEAPTFLYDVITFYLNRIKLSIDDLCATLCLDKVEFEQNYYSAINSLRLVR